MRLALRVFLACSGLALAEVRPPTPVEQEEIQAAMHRMVSAVNNRDVVEFRKSVVPAFDMVYPGIFVMTLDRSTQLLAKPQPEWKTTEIATLVRFLKMLSSDVAVVDGYFRTIRSPAGETAGRFNATLVREPKGGWLVATVRFMPYPFDKDFSAVEPAREHMPAGPDGWVTLFDGKSLGALTGVGGGPETLAKSWTIEDGYLKAIAGRGVTGIRTKDTFGSFELQFEWKLPAKGNSGVKYRLFYMSPRDGTGHEYQIADDAGDPGAVAHPVERSGALYNQIAPVGAVVKPLGEFNKSVLVVRARHSEHWLNGVKVVEYETESGPLEGPILLQHHTTDAWYRNIRIRRLD